MLKIGDKVIGITERLFDVNTNTDYNVFHKNYVREIEVIDYENNKLSLLGDNLNIWFKITDFKLKYSNELEYEIC